jgi:hypothetical protein
VKRTQHITCARENALILLTRRLIRAQQIHSCSDSNLVDGSFEGKSLLPQWCDLLRECGLRARAALMGTRNADEHSHQDEQQQCKADGEPLADTQIELHLRTPMQD